MHSQLTSFTFGDIISPSQVQKPLNQDAIPWPQQSGYTARFISTQKAVTPLEQNRSKIHHTFETVFEAPEGENEDAQDSRFYDLASDILQYLSTEMSFRDGGYCQPENCATPKPKPPPRPPTPYPRPKPGGGDEKKGEKEEIRPRRRRLSTRSIEGPPGPPPPYPPPPIPGPKEGYFHIVNVKRGEEVVQVRMLRMRKKVSAGGARKTPPKESARRHFLSLTLDEQRWGVVDTENSIEGQVNSGSSGLGTPKPVLCPRSKPLANPEELVVCVITDDDSRMASGNSVDIINSDIERERAASTTPICTAAISEVYYMKDAPDLVVPPCLPSPHASKIEDQDGGDCSNTAPGPPATPSPAPAPAQITPKREWDSSQPKPTDQAGIDTDTQGEIKKETSIGRSLFAQRKMNFSRLRSAASLGSLRKVARGDECHHAYQRGGSISSTSTWTSPSPSPSPSISTSSSPNSQSKRSRAVEVHGDKASIRKFSFPLVSFGVLSSASSIAPSTRSSRSRPRRKMYSLTNTSAADSSRTVTPSCSSGTTQAPGDPPGVPVAQPKKSLDLRKMSSEEFLRAVKLRKNMAIQNIIALEEKEKALRGLSNGRTSAGECYGSVESDPTGSESGNTSNGSLKGTNSTGLFKKVRRKT